MKWILVTAYLATYGSSNTYMTLDVNQQKFDTYAACYSLGIIMQQAASSEMKFDYECVGYDDGWF